MKAPQYMTAGAINRELDELRERSSSVTSRMIEAGRGHEKPRETVAKDDPLSVEYREVQDRIFRLRLEIKQRSGKNYGRMPRGLRRITT